jgi:hypothetical protein
MPAPSKEEKLKENSPNFIFTYFSSFVNNLHYHDMFVKTDVGTLLLNELYILFEYQKFSH